MKERLSSVLSASCLEGQLSSYSSGADSFLLPPARCNTSFHCSPAKDKNTPKHMSQPCCKLARRSHFTGTMAVEAMLLCN